MGIFSRISNILGAKVNDALDQVENPIEMLDQKLRDMEAALNEAKSASAMVLGNVHQTEKKMNDALERSKDWENKFQKAKAASEKASADGNEQLAAEHKELAKEVWAKKIETDKSYQTLKSTYEAQRADGDKLKAKLIELEEEIERTRTYRIEAEARLANADAGQKVGEIMANVQTRSGDISIDSIERKISQKEAMADGLTELAHEGDSLDAKLKALDETNLDEDFEKQWGKS
ncbi:PspA/IM30 family protein [Desulfosporosinus sp. SB140]|uniref:PspA/IM30 family protein n=1 Tax=Desulfosporosinus paludis TaxID=3115649 RepID=UPI00389090DD